jgi:hypothetical protein
MSNLSTLNTRRTLRRLVLLLAVALVVTACGRKASDIKSVPEASIVYPGSTLVSSGGSDGGPIWKTAGWGAEYEVDAAWSAVSAYYHDKLVALGYTPEPSDQIGGNPADEYQKDGRAASLEQLPTSPGATATKYNYEINQS